MEDSESIIYLLKYGLPLSYLCFSLVLVYVSHK